MHNQLDSFASANRRGPEQVLDVDHTQAAQLHVVLDQLRALAQQDVAAPATNFHDIVGHQPVTTNYQIERALTLAHSRLPRNENADAIYVHQHSMH